MKTNTDGQYGHYGHENQSDHSIFPCMIFQLTSSSHRCRRCKYRHPDFTECTSICTEMYGLRRRTEIRESIFIRY